MIQTIKIKRNGNTNYFNESSTQINKRKTKNETNKEHIIKIMNVNNESSNEKFSPPASEAPNGSDNCHIDCCPDCCYCCSNCFVKFCLTLLMSIPFFTVTLILSICAVISNIFVGIYFFFIGWIVDIKCGHCGDKCIAKSIQGPWIPVKAYCERIYTIC